VSNKLSILLANIAACGQRIQKLTYSLNKNRGDFSEKSHLPSKKTLYQSTHA